VGALFLFIAGAGVNQLTSTLTGNTAQRGHATATTDPTSTPNNGSAGKQWGTVQHITGNQNQQTPVMHIAAGSRIVWSVQPGPSSAGNFICEADYTNGTLAGQIANAQTPPAQHGIYTTHSDVEVYFAISSDGNPYVIDVQVYK
jgi:hypothetical protein